VSMSFSSKVSVTETPSPESNMRPTSSSPSVQHIGAPEKRHQHKRVDGTGGELVRRQPSQHIARAAEDEWTAAPRWIAAVLGWTRRSGPSAAMGWMYQAS
jgi:hypothetical protein